VGGKVDVLLLGPTGGLISPRVPDEPDVQAFVAIAGPIVHLALVVVSAAIIAVAGDAQSIIGLLNPATPEGIVDSNGGPDGPIWLVAARLTLWINWVLMLLNLLPAYPFDGGPALRALLWPALGRKTACLVTSRIAMTIAIGFCVLAAVGVDPQAPLFWVPLVTLGIFLFFSARQDQLAAESIDPHDDLIGYQMTGEGLDLLDAMWSDDDEKDAVLVEQRKESQEGRGEKHSGDHEAAEDARVDDILARLHQTGIGELSREEIEVLQRASRRYRDRHRPS
jgi:Zn-dependent protease